jgi:hypothetical protein
MRGGFDGRTIHAHVRGWWMGVHPQPEAALSRTPPVKKSITERSKVGFRARLQRGSMSNVTYRTNTKTFMNGVEHFRDIH